MSGFRAAFSVAGVDTVAIGDVRLVSDEHLTLTARGIGQEKQRRVIIVGNEALLQDKGFPLVWGVPCTASPMFSGGVLHLPLTMSTGKSGS